MSISFQAKDSQILGQQLKVQEIVVKHGSPLLEVSGADILIDIKEEIESIELVLFKDDSAVTVAPIAQANLSVDSSTKIKIASLTTAANDVLVVKYIVK